MTKKISKNKKNNTYNADNEIIIGVTTKQKEEKKHTKLRVNHKRDDLKKELKSKKEKKISKRKNISKSKKIKNNNTFQETTEQMIKRKNRKRLFISIVMLIVAIIGGTIFFLTTPRFNITEIEITGNYKNTVDTYISLSKIELGTTNIFGISSKRIQTNLKENAYVESVSITRKLPNILEISVTERKVTYQVEMANRYLYFNEQGYLLEISEEKADVIFLKGLTSIQENMTEGNRLNEQDLKKLSFILEFTNYCKYHSIENTITTIDVTDTNDYKVYFEKDHKVLYLGNASNLNERLSLLKAILNAEKNKKGEIFMNGNITEDKVFFRENITK